MHYYIRDLGEVFGPMSKAAIVDELRDGRFHDSEVSSVSADGPWIEIVKVQSLRQEARITEPPPARSAAFVPVAPARRSIGRVR